MWYFRARSSLWSQCVAQGLLFSLSATSARWFVLFFCQVFCHSFFSFSFFFLLPRVFFSFFLPGGFLFFSARWWSYTFAQQTVSGLLLLALLSRWWRVYWTASRRTFHNRQVSIPYSCLYFMCICVCVFVSTHEQKFIESQKNLTIDRFHNLSSELKSKYSSFMK